MEEAYIKEFLRQRKVVGRTIDPETAEVDWAYGYIVDPYALYDDLAPEEKCLGRVYFACTPGSDGWVCFYDLPMAARDRLWEIHRGKLAFPSSLPL